MNKKVIIAALLTLISLTMTAQEHLIRIDSEDIAWRKKSRLLSFFDEEKARLLIPSNAVFGVECIPSFSPEWSLTYDSVAHALIYNEAQKSIWHSTYDAMHKKKTKTDRKSGRTVTRRKLRKHPKGYVAPDVTTCTLAISAEQAQMLKAIWTNAIGTSILREDNMLDGITWAYFMGEQRAKARTANYSIVKLTNKLVEAVKAADICRCDSLVGAEFQRIAPGLEMVPN